MHEISIAQSMLETAEATLEGHPVKRATAVHVRVGVLSGVDPESLGFAWEVVAADSPLFAGSDLMVETVGLSGSCDACGAAFDIDDLQFSCPECESPQIRVTSGDELDMVDIEVEGYENEPHSA